MPFRAGLTAVTLILGGCATDRVSSVEVTAASGKGADLAATCVAGTPCALAGTLVVERRSGDNSFATINRGSACAPLLLPAAVYAQWRRWDGKSVRVTGTALARGAALPEVLLLQYRDRWLSPSVCSWSPLALYVDEIALAGRSPR